VRPAGKPRRVFVSRRNGASKCNFKKDKGARMNRRVDGGERTNACRGRIRFILREIGETHDMVQARMRAKIGSGEASEDDRFVTFAWPEP
jgi:hypothetical protein